MAKKIYVVTFTDGTENTYTTQKEFKALEGIAKVMCGEEDITSKFVKEDELMALTVIEETAEVVATLDEVVEPTTEPTIEGPETYLYVKAARDNSKLFWDVLPVEGFEMGMTFKEIEGLLPNPIHELARNVIFVAMSRVLAFVDDGKQYGIKTTNKDFAKNYTKIMGDELVSTDTLVRGLYKEVIEAVYDGKTSGEWVAPVAEEVEEEDQEVA